ncbi:MAG TPA: hypothetical protein VF868_10605 [Bacteroidia bacterium]|jgi:hypothetical protein
MRSYSSRSGKPSGVIAYETGEDFIIVQFKSGDIYTYSDRRAGKKHVDAMKSRATARRGLSTYISQNKPRYDS